MEFGDYIVYVDESGDHGLKGLDPFYPIFVLSFCVFEKREYIENVVPLIQNFKFKYFGHDQIVLHENEIRKQKENFAFLMTDPKLREHFINDLNIVMTNADFSIFSVVINKRNLIKKYSEPYSPYYIGMQFGMELLFDFFLYNGQENKNISIVFEKRGAKEDNELELEFRRLISGEYHFGWKKKEYEKIDFNLIFADKRSNSTGLQLADLTARPIGLNYLRKNQRNRAYEIIEEKIKRCKVFPK